MCAIAVSISEGEYFVVDGMLALCADLTRIEKTSSGESRKECNINKVLIGRVSHARYRQGIYSQTYCMAIVTVSKIHELIFFPYLGRK